MTTPNAVSFHKRIIFLMGRDPAERIRFYTLNPGDYRQYTRDEISSIILMALAAGDSSLTEALQDVSPINDPVLIMVAENDLYQDNHVQLVNNVYDTLISAGKDVTLILYPPYDANGDGTIDDNDDGHELFWSVQNPYWSDLIKFLDQTISSQ